jgi:tetratricopeptide (TPR) repeat protein
LPEAKLRGNSSVDVLFLYTRSLIDQGQSQRAEQILADRCRNWSLSTSCVAKLTILVDRELYNAAGEGWRRMQSSNVRLDGHTEARFWLAGAKIAIAQTQTEVGFERFETALKTAAEVPFPSLRRETYESYAMAIYGVQDWNMLRKVVGRALTEFQAQPKQPLLKLATLRDLGTGSNARQALTNVLEGTDLITRLVGDVDFLDILGVEALRLGLEDSLVRVLKRSQRQDSVRALWNRRLEQWQVRALLASRRFDDALVMLNQTQGLADDPVTLHLRGVAYLSLATDSRYYLLAAEQFQLALKQKLNWESLCALGFALARAGKMDQVPSIISQLEQTATKAMEIQWTRLLQSEYLALTGEPVAAMGILEKVIAVDPNSFVAHEQLVRRYQQIGDMQKKGIQELKYDELRRDLRYNETDEGMTAPIGPFAMASRLGVLKR